MSKVYCCVYNGLGNQLFGYALGMYVSRRHNKELHVDLTKLNTINMLAKLGLKKDTPREYELHKLGFKNPVKKFNHYEFTRKFRFFNKKNCHIADFRNGHEELELRDENQKIYTIGWGEFGRVKEILPELRKQLTPNFKITPEVGSLIQLIQTKNTVALHVRRTDYLNQATGKRFNGICTDEYYRNAISFMKEKLDKPYFILFSDDVKYVKENLKLENSCIVSGNAGYVDLYLMSQCRHYILANSTFSFWGAMLNDSEKKLVCTPEYWYNNPLENESYIPQEWIKIPIQ
ncbi:MAG TPA: alpha-1,2-fucosyltransferase [Sunxiuqinia sp.]|nr:alpha-1,2-fucosyltransferase [Sunxiuqinia sp.]